MKVPNRGAGDGTWEKMLAQVQQQADAAGKGRPRTRPDRVLADKGYPSTANRAWLRDRGITATIPEHDDQIAHRRNKPGRPIDFGHQQSATSTETSSSNASTSSSNGAESRWASTRPLATTEPPPASPPL